MTDEPKSVGDVLDRLSSTAGEGDEVSVEDMSEAVGRRSYGPFLLVPALIEMSPIGGLPGLPTVIALFILFVAAQMLRGRRNVRLPGLLSSRSVPAERLEQAARKLRPVARFADRWFHQRFRSLTNDTFAKVAAVCVILLALSVPPLEFIPFASTIPMAGIAAFGLALMVRDGLLMVAALLLAGGGAVFGLGLLAA